MRDAKRKAADGKPAFREKFIHKLGHMLTGPERKNILIDENPLRVSQLQRYVDG